MEITVIYDNYQEDERLRTDHGFACLIERGEERILFDSGGDDLILLGNMEKLGINPSQIETVFLSHIHGDHTGGLAGFLEKNSQVRVYLPACFPGSLVGQIESKGGKVVRVDEPVRIGGGMYSTGEMGRVVKEQALVLSGEKGGVVITGCAHPGVAEMVDKAKKLLGEGIYLVLGGFHLGGASEARLERVIREFRQLGVQKVGPCHCSGDRCRELFAEEYQEDFVRVGVGKKIKI